MRKVIYKVASKTGSQTITTTSYAEAMEFKNGHAGSVITTLLKETHAPKSTVQEKFEKEANEYNKHFKKNVLPY